MARFTKINYRELWEVSMNRSPRSRNSAAVALTAGAIAALLSLAGCAAEQPAEPPESPSPAPTTTPPTEEPSEPLGPRQSTTGLAAPWSIAYVENSALVSERDSGKLIELTEDGASREIATIPGVVHGGEGGFLGIAVSPAPEGTQPEFLYAYSTASSGNRVQRFPLTGTPGSLAIGEATPIVEGLPSATSHNGGRIAFGPDGMLYVTVGDASQPWLSQDLDSLAGKILRLTPDGGVPDDNPFEGSPVYTSGHRNPQGIAWAADGTMYSSEFGQDTWDELNVITAGSNYGWPEVEGIAGDDRYVDPVQQWTPAEASPSGIAITSDTIYIANLRGQRVRTVPLSDLTTGSDHFVEEYGRIRDVTVSPDGKLWLLSNNTDGRVEPRAGDDRFIDSGLVK
ncbi:PQQ-dependent sugar dehydrogenase [Leucobacter aridicollis]|uniref:PQQ-dependent sugar dehydrogenase n=1 Tax=Leucobacter aridicollis TaxID=283878 RepID=UPI0021039D32|nr:PQQ-dependent sugar dehydrogenase [Leucobacter aridicollis]